MADVLAARETPEEYERRKARGMAPEDMTWQESQHRVDELRRRRKLVKVTLSATGHEDVETSTEKIHEVSENFRRLNQPRMTGEELREQICSTLNEALPDLKHAVRQYMTQEAVHDKDFKAAAAIWRSLDSVADATAKLSQSEMP